MGSTSLASTLESMEDYVADDVPPAYDEELPGYERSSLSTPLIKLQFRQTSKKQMTLVSLDHGHAVQYMLTSKGGLRNFGRSTSPSFLTVKSKDSSSDGSDGMRIADMSFDSNSSLPWFPRASMTFDVAGLAAAAATATPMTTQCKVHMESRNFSDWTFSWNDGVHDMNLRWALEKRPTALALREASSGFCVARFNYSAHGTMAKDGQPIGELEIYHGAGDLGLGTETIICSCNIVIKHWLNLGRHYRRDIAPEYFNFR